MAVNETRRLEAELLEARAGEALAAHAPARVLTITRRGLTPADWIVGGYLVFSTVVMLIHPHSIAKLPMLLALRGALGGFLVLCAAGRLPRRLAWIQDWYPVLLAPLFYSEAGLINRAFTDGYFDLHVEEWEASLFGGQPSVTLRDRLSGTWFSEYVHLAYFSYYFLAPAMALFLYLRGRMRDFQVYMATVTTTFMTCLAIFIMFPVAGPYYIFTPPDPRSMGPLIPPMVHWLLRHGSSIGTAFPSSHVAVSVTVLLMAWRFSRIAFVLLLMFVPALAVGAVYGGFHYAIDTLAGLVLAVLVCRIVPERVKSRLA